jgi:uncharacterized membrane protein
VGNTAANSISISVPAATKQNLANFALYLLIAIYAVSRVLQGFPQSAPMLVIVTLHVVPPLLFALLHGRMLWGWRGILVFFAICSVVSGTVEKIGITTGFPFGHYYFTDAMGPKISGVPIFLGLAYLGMGYVSWLIASLILGWQQRELTGWRVVALPAFAALVMTSWDFCLDPVWSTIVRAWRSVISSDGTAMSSSYTFSSRSTSAAVRQRRKQSRHDSGKLRFCFTVSRSSAIFSI